jgi:alkylation response protein AidB-like acyl-CoA dehydrogenase
MDGPKPDVARAEAREVAEGAREAARTLPSFAAELFLGTLRADLVLPFPEQDPRDRAEADGFLARFAEVLETSIDPSRVDRAAELPEEAVRRLHEVGAFRLKLPREVGGLGFSQLNYNRAVALAGSWCGSTAIWLSGHQSIGVPTPLRLFGSEEQKAEYLPRLAKGELSAFALTEPEVGSDPARMETTAVPSPDGEIWTLNGEKLWCTNGPVADVLVVMARTPDVVEGGRPRKRISAFIVESRWPGVETTHRCDFLGYRGIQNGLLRFTDVRVPRRNLLWGEGQGLKLALITLNTGRLTLPATNTAVARQCLQIVRRWAGTRQQWGAPIGRHEAVATMLGWIASHTFAMEAVGDYASALADRHDRDIRIEAALAKLFCSETAWRVADLTMQVRGGRGYETAESLAARGETPFPVERIWREARLNTIVEGTSEILRLFLAREAMDPHLAVLGALADPRASFGRKAKAVLRAAVRYPPWYARRVLPPVAVPAAVPEPLRGAWRRTRFGARNLALWTFHAMLRHGPGLEHRQALLGRIVDEGVDLAASALAIARAASRGDAASVELADLFCRHAEARSVGRRAHPTRLDRAGRRVAEGVLAGRHRRLEEGILPYCPEEAREPTGRETTRGRPPARRTGP